MKNFEKNAKKYFHQRKIQPSENTWERMEMLLDKQQTKKKKSYGYLWSAAASVILLIGLWATMQKPEEKMFKPIENPVVLKKESVQKKDAKTDKKEVSTNQSTRKKPTKKTIQIIQNQPFVTEKHIATEDKNTEEKQSELSTDFTIVSPAEIYKKEQLLAERNPVEIYVDPEKLLYSAEIERQVENIYTDGQNLWRKIKEINASVEPNNLINNEENNF